MFLRNAWYVAAWDHEVKRHLMPVTLLGERLVLYRTSAGDPVALEDACLHRKLPLSLGRLKGDQIECGYHGMVYDCTGQCVHVPGVERAPARFRVRSYPVVSRYGLVWIWFGQVERATVDSLPPVEHWDDPSWGRNSGGSMNVACHYLLVTDNLLDPSHVAWVHGTSFGNEACAETPIETQEEPAGIVAQRWMQDVEVAPFYAPLVGFHGRCDRLQRYEVRYPSHAIIRAVFVPAGAGGVLGVSHPLAMIMDSYNFITPVDGSHSLYFWFQLRNFAPTDEQISRNMDEDVRAAFSEDRAVLEAIQANMRTSSDRHIDLGSDRAPLAFRRRLAQLIEVESAGGWSGRGASEPDRSA